MREKNNKTHNLLLENYELGFAKVRQLPEATNLTLNHITFKPSTKVPNSMQEFYI